MTDETNQAAEDADSLQINDETQVEQQEPAPETTPEQPVVEEENSAVETTDDSVSRETLGICAELAALVSQLQTAPNKSQECWALHKVEGLLWSLKGSLPEAVTALGTENADLATALQSLLSVL